MPVPDMRDSDPSVLSDLLDFENIQRPWQPAELAAVLRHQLAAPIEFDLAAKDDASAELVRTITRSHGLMRASVGDLLRHPHPPIELLEMLKDFAKAHVLHPASPLPREIAAVLYYSAILVARACCDREISRLAARPLQERVESLLRQDWLDDATRALFTDAVRGRSASESVHD